MLLLLIACLSPIEPVLAGAGPCMYEAASDSYKQCAHAAMGVCHHFTTSCEPE